ncbi:hypothetical protein [Methylobacterium sp. J-070]|nr:hypothetical protein [Methylobacterium sp. J-070]
MSGSFTGGQGTAGEHRTTDAERLGGIAPGADRDRNGAAQADE